MGRLTIIGVIFLFAWLLLPCALHAAETSRILLINSNAAVSKYAIVQNEFINNVNGQVLKVDLAGREMDEDELAKVVAYDPDLVFCIGAKAYSFAYKTFRHKYLVFSSIINWLRIPRTDKTYGVSNELHTRMQIFMFRSIFPKVKKIGIIYSKRFSRQWFNNARTHARDMGLEIIGKSVSRKGRTISSLRRLLPDVDALWLISDPLVMPEKKYLYKILDRCDREKVPVFSYHDAFAEVGASLIVSADVPTIGRQAAGITMEILSGGKIDDPVQFPAGSHITLNLKKVESYGIEYNHSALSSVNNIIK